MTRKRNSRQLHGLGNAILSSAQMPDAVIDQITGDPQLFARMMSDVEKQREIIPRELANGPSLFPRLRLAVGFASVAVVVGLVTLLLIFSSPIPTSEVSSVPAVIVEDLEPAQLERFQYRPGGPPAVASARVRRGVTRSRVTRLASPALEADENPFVQVAFTGELNDESVQIIRVELPRASLFAMGVSVPVENEGNTAKADLLLGSDGTVKGVRLAKL